MDNDTRRSAWAYLRRVIDKPSSDLNELLWPTGDPAAPAQVIEVAERIQQRDPDLPEPLLEMIEGRTAFSGFHDLVWAESAGWRLLTPDDDEWPSEVIAGADAAAPFALYVRGTGDLAEMLKSAVTVTGTRVTLQEQCAAASNIGSTLSNSGRTIVSSGGVGIDNEVLGGALITRRAARALAVLPCGPGVDYPRSNVKEFDYIAQRGLLVTEHAPGDQPSRQRILETHRILAAMGEATVMVAAAYRSGSLDVCAKAKSLGRPVFALTGPENVTNYVGNLQLIEDDRAAAFDDADDLLAKLDA